MLPKSVNDKWFIDFNTWRYINPGRDAIKQTKFKYFQLSVYVTRSKNTKDWLYPDEAYI